MGPLCVQLKVYPNLSPALSFHHQRILASFSPTFQQSDIVTVLRRTDQALHLTPGVLLGVPFVYVD